MKTLTNTIYPAFTAFVLACVALSPTARAVTPAPDGGYPGGNTAEGQGGLLSLSTGGYNTAVGFFSLKSDTTNSFNTAVGAGALFVNNADQNTATGAGALLSNTIGTGNTATGAFALFANTAGSENTTLGSGAGTGVTTGSGNICIGAMVSGVAGENNTVRIGDNLPTGAGESACYIGGIVGQSVDPGSGTTVYIDSTGRLGMFFSSRRFKHDIEPMDEASESILALKPVTFHYSSDRKNTPCYGLIAEEVAEVSPDLVVRDKEGKPYSVRYDQVNAMLLNEFLKEHCKVKAQEAVLAQLKSNAANQEATIAHLQKQIEALTLGLQKVSAAIEVSKPAAQVTFSKQP